MKKFLLFLLLLIPFAAASFDAAAQETDPVIPGADSLLASRVDSTLVGRDVLSLLSENVKLEQTPQVTSALGAYIRTNAEKPIQGYRVRVFYDNSPQARTKSENIESLLKSQYPGTGVYRSFESPSYKVTVGDFRTKEDALKLFMALRRTYPTAYIIKENINYPR